MFSTIDGSLVNVLLAASGDCCEVELLLGSPLLPSLVSIRRVPLGPATGEPLLLPSAVEPEAQTMQAIHTTIS